MESTPPESITFSAYPIGVFIQIRTGKSCLTLCFSGFCSSVWRSNRTLYPPCFCCRSHFLLLLLLCAVAIARSSLYQAPRDATRRMEMWRKIMDHEDGRWKGRIMRIAKMSVAKIGSATCNLHDIKFTDQNSRLLTIFDRPTHIFLQSRLRKLL